MNRLIHTPEGVRDYYNLDCARKMEVSERMNEVLKSYGYHFIQTPTFEYFDIFSEARGSAKSREMYKFFDHNNDTLVLRPDITPSIARAASKYYLEEDMPLRLCYQGNVFVNNLSYQGKMTEMTHVGAELLGDETSDADAEIISMVIDCLKTSGLGEYQVEIGNVEFFNGLMEETGLSDEEVADLRALIENKNYSAIDKLLSGKEIKDDLKKMILKLPELFGSAAILDAAAGLTKNERALAAIDRLKKVYQILQFYKIEDCVSFDLGMLSNYKYYTGMIFQAFSYGTGEKIVTGGRYDGLVGQYGKNCPAVGFAIKLDVLMLALSRQNIEIQTDVSNSVIVLYERECREKAISLACELRKSKRVTLMKKYREKNTDDYLAFAARSFAGVVYYMNENGDVETLKVKEG